MDGGLLTIILVFSPFLIGVLVYFIGCCFTVYQERKQWEETGGTLPDWVEQMNTIYESPLDWEDDNKMTAPYECPHCGAQNQTKVICEYCRSRNERATKKTSKNSLSF